MFELDSDKCCKWCIDQSNKHADLDASWLDSCKKSCAEGADHHKGKDIDRDDLYSIASRMEFATDGQCSEYLDYL